MRRVIACLILITTLVVGCSGPSLVSDDSLARELAKAKSAHAKEVDELKQKIVALDTQLMELKLRSDELAKANDSLTKTNEMLTSICDALHLKTASLLKDLPFEELAEEDLLYLLIYGLHNGDASCMNSIFSRRFLAALPGGKYSPIKPSRLKSIAIYKGPFNAGSTIKVVEFTVETDDGPFWKGQHVFFPRFVKEQGQLKIDALPTSP